MGYHLGSSKAPDAYEAIVYEKGAIVFRMLALSLGEGGPGVAPSREGRLFSSGCGDSNARRS